MTITPDWKLKRYGKPPRTHCVKAGHEFTPENTVMSGGYRRCRECDNARGRANKAKQRSGPFNLSKEDILRKDRVYQVRKHAKLMGLPIPALPNSREFMKKDSLQYLKLDPEASKASDTLNFAIDRTNQRPLCESDVSKWMDYDEPPTDEEAKLMCGGCPVQAECDSFAEATKPIVGCWAGSVWIPDPKRPNGMTGIRRTKSKIKEEK